MGYRRHPAVLLFFTLWTSDRCFYNGCLELAAPRHRPHLLYPERLALLSASKSAPLISYAEESDRNPLLILADPTERRFLKDTPIPRLGHIWTAGRKVKMPTSCLRPAYVLPTSCLR
jgi:hypothetical protein